MLISYIFLLLLDKHNTNVMGYNKKDSPEGLPWSCLLKLYRLSSLRSSWRAKRTSCTSKRVSKSFDMV